MLKRTAISSLVSILVLLPLGASAATIATTHKTHPKSHKITETSTTQKKIARTQHSTKTSAARNASSYKVSKAHRYHERFYASSFAENQMEGDITAGEDPIVRAAAVEALGNMNGTVVAMDPDSGRVLAMVNQKLALSAGAQPCSTIKVAVALAALSENVITKDTQVPLAKYWRVDLTTALAKSNNAYFEAVGRKLGFERVSYYGHQFGLGEMAGWNIDGEHLGTFPSTELDAKLGGVGKMCSFGESISLTPLQLAALMGAIANGGTLYYLQHPTTPEEITNFTPKVKRKLDIGPLIPEISEGMSGAVEYGTARSLRTSFIEEPILGKTGTCSKDGTRFGWFGSYANTQYGRIVTVIFLEGGRPTFGPKAAELAGHLYRNLYDHDFFAVKPPTVPVHTAATGIGATQ
ncbi:MAG: penicillin-binding transpeptidase domain-containing protein [Candidatus Korobacteraceae bacterium]|jgi:cell division protein FtsI/penicillin-binding protein 2